MEGCHAGIKVVTPQVVHRDETLVMGVEVRTSTQREMNFETAEIPKLWNRFLAEQIWLDIPDVVNSQTFYGVYTDYATEALGEYSLVLAAEVTSIDNPPESMVGIAIPEGQYLVFSAVDCRPEAVIQTWQQIGGYFSPGSRYQRAFTTDFELYEQQQVHIYIAVK